MGAGGGAAGVNNALGPVSGQSGPSSHDGAGGNGGGGTSNNNLNTGNYPGASPNINGVANTGSGGAGGHGASGSGLNNSTSNGGAGGSGVVILRYDSSVTATYTSGVTYTTSVVGGDKVDTITSTSNNSQTVTFS